MNTPPNGEAKRTRAVVAWGFVYSVSEQEYGELLKSIAERQVFDWSGKATCLGQPLDVQSINPKQAAKLFTKWLKVQDDTFT